MPRINRKISYTKTYHIILRGIDKQDIFLCENDYCKFLETLNKVKKQYECDIYSYCLMNNHVHIVIYDKGNKLPKIMQSIEISYSLYFNKKYNRVGHLFQNRYLSKNIEDREYLKMVCRYIHQNPQKAGIGSIEDYKWSSYKEYIKNPKIINNNVLLKIFSEDLEKAKNEFIKFHNIQINNVEELIEYEIIDKLTDDQVIEYICEFMNIDNVHKILELNVEKRNETIRKIKENKKITSAQISRVLGINRKIVERIK